MHNRAEQLLKYKTGAAWHESTDVKVRSSRLCVSSGLKVQCDSSGLCSQFISVQLIQMSKYTVHMSKCTELNCACVF